MAVGELKGESFSPSDKGQLYHYQQDLLELQLYRHALYGFLFINQDMLLVSACQEVGAILFKVHFENGFSDEGRAWDCLSYLASGPLDQLMFKNPVGPDITVKDFLGRGHFSIVYSGIYKEQEVVVKVRRYSNQAVKCL